jgi:hypothetical protein
MRRKFKIFVLAAVVAATWGLKARGEPAASSGPSHYLVVRLTADAFTSLTDRPIDRVSNVNEIILGTHVVGTARTVGRPEVQLQENPTEAGFQVELTGSSTTRTQGYNGPVVIHSRTTSQFRSKKYVVFVPGEGFRSGPATTEARSQTVTERIDANRRGIIGRIIQRKASEAVAAQRAQCEAIAREKTIRRVNKLFDEYLEARLARLNQRVAMIATISVLRGKESEPFFFCCSTPQHVLIALARGREPFNVQLPELPGARPPVQFWIHKSVLGGDLGQRLVNMAKTGLAAKNLLDWSRDMLPVESFTTLSQQEDLPALKMGLDAVDDWYVLEFGELPATETLARATQ